MALVALLVVLAGVRLSSLLPTVLLGAAVSALLLFLDVMLKFLALALDVLLSAAGIGGVDGELGDVVNVEMFACGRRRGAGAGARTGRGREREAEGEGGGESQAAPNSRRVETLVDTLASGVQAAPPDAERRGEREGGSGREGQAAPESKKA